MTTETGTIPDDEDDATLVLRALVGDLGAFDGLVRRYRGAALAVAQGVTGSFDRAQDAAQDAFVLAFSKLPQLDDPARFASWLCAIVRHRATRLSMRDNRAQPTEPEELEAYVLRHSGEVSPHPVEEMIRRIEGISVRNALGNLPEEIQVVMRLYYYEDWPVKRIAEFLSLPATTVKWRLHEGRRRLKRTLCGMFEEDDDE